MRASPSEWSCTGTASTFVCDGYPPSPGGGLFSPTIQLTVLKLMAAVLLNSPIPFSYLLPTSSWSLSPAGGFRGTTMHVTNPL